MECFGVVNGDVLDENYEVILSDFVALILDMFDFWSYYSGTGWSITH